MVCWGFRGEGFRVYGFRGLAFRGLGFRGLGLRGLGFRCLGFPKHSRSIPSPTHHLYIYGTPPHRTPEKKLTKGSLP